MFTYFIILILDPWSEESHSEPLRDLSCRKRELTEDDTFVSVPYTITTHETEIHADLTQTENVFTPLYSGFNLMFRPVIESYDPTMFKLISYLGDNELRTATFAIFCKIILFISLIRLYSGLRSHLF